MSNKQNGFGIVEIIIVVAVVALAGFGGWYVWQANSNKNTANNSQAPAKNDESSAPNTTTGDTKYLTIKEWGIKFALTADTADAYYDDVTSSPIDSFSLRSHSLDASKDCKTGSQSVATIFRTPKDGSSQGDQPNKMYAIAEDGVTIGDYLYFITGAQYGCTEDLELAVTLQAVRQAFITAEPTIEKVD